MDTLNDDQGPPFKDKCLCDFKSFGKYEISKDNYNEYFSGKGWNPKLNACSWIWGELVYNETPNDSTVTLFKVHLLDLDNFRLPTNKTEYGNDSFKKYVIAIYKSDSKKGYDTIIYDPYKTGKYPAPR